jgi:plastocyanin
MIMKRRPQIALASAVAAAAALAGSCRKSNPTSPSPSTCTAPATSTTITIANNAVCPQNITVPRGTQVTFINQDSVAHEMYSDPHPEHTDCPELNDVGHLEPNQRRASGNLNTPRSCGFHDHLRPDVAGLRGRITIQ